MTGSEELESVLRFAVGSRKGSVILVVDAETSFVRQLQLRKGGSQFVLGALSDKRTSLLDVTCEDVAPLLRRICDRLGLALWRLVLSDLWGPLSLLELDGSEESEADN